MPEHITSNFWQLFERECLEDDKGEIHRGPAIIRVTEHPDIGEVLVQAWGKNLTIKAPDLETAIQNCLEQSASKS